ncbi:MAG: hypothetical protein QN174_07015 [Armatimonadota bacterium]|nr:hypothetical protein [Armatimonadota bacterium]MDR7423460.1 hypothetical protein [Armatimonadota bacterium]MDR7453731.1 hypothetical protein [Armatimonadota bacterium]MDR7456395.1 hypothetical protein [Armatimonadota bacterium]MDR7496691.1 hypothetical protein [Armatimonadota bacterium]
MVERQAVLIVLWALAVMIVVGAVLPAVAPGLIRFVNRTVLKEDAANHQSGH